MEEEIKNEEVREVAPEEAQKDQKGESEKPLDKMTAKELREMALEIPGITGVHAMKKEELLKAIKEAKGIKDEEPIKERKKKTPKKEVSVKELKKKVVRLKEEKEAAREAEDRKKVDILRRRINRLKKQTRKVAQA